MRHQTAPTVLVSCWVFFLVTALAWEGASSCAVGEPETDGELVGVFEGVGVAE
jgi:hypothetical protein